MLGLGLQEIILILIVALIVIGPKKLPELAKGLGKAVREFKRATEDIKQNLDIEPEDLNIADSLKTAHTVLPSDNHENEKKKRDEVIERDDLKSNGG